MSAHVRQERATREAFKRDGHGADLPDQIGIAWCGANCSNKFMFLDAAHALLSLKYSGGVGACKKCLRAIRLVIDNELNDRLDR